MKKMFLVLSLLASHFAQAAVLDFEALYRLEWMQIDRPTLGTPASSKSYGLHSLSLYPKLIASDGIEIRSKLDFFSSQEDDYKQSQLGTMWGQGFSSPAASNAKSNALSRGKDPVPAVVSQLYLQAQQEYGTFYAGRMPLNFGLGITFNDGKGPFDHWSTVFDLIGYKFYIGNVQVFPAISRQSNQDFSVGNSVQDQMILFQYDNKDSGSLLGILYDERKAAASSTANDLPTGADTFGGAGATGGGALSVKTTSFILGRSWDEFRFRIETAIQSGDLGVQNANGEAIRINGYGIASEFEFGKPDDKNLWKLRLGAASGDDPNTKDFEGFAFHRNYDIALMMFNHRLGQKDFFRTNYLKNTARTAGNSLDDEAISNAFYISPKLTTKWKDNMDVVQTLTYAQLLANSTGSNNLQKDLGYEYDFELVYRPRKNVQWSNEVGFLLPGQAYQDGDSRLTAGFAFGFTSRAAFSF